MTEKVSKFMDVACTDLCIQVLKLMYLKEMYEEKTGKGIPKPKLSRKKIDRIYWRIR